MKEGTPFPHTEAEFKQPAADLLKKNISTPLEDLLVVESNVQWINLGENLAKAARAKQMWDKAQVNLKYLQGVERDLPENYKGVSYFSGSYYIGCFKKLFEDLKNSDQSKKDPKKLTEDIVRLCEEVDRQTQRLKEGLEKPHTKS